jgi:uncharacterized membrane protein
VRPRSSLDNSGRSYRIALLLILLLSWLLLNLQLDRRSLWTDELFTASWTHLSVTELIQRTADDYHPPFYFLLVQGWAKLAGNNDFALRWPSVVSGWLSISVLYRLVRLLDPAAARRDSRAGVIGQPVALLACGMWSFSPLFILYTRMARYYALTAFLALVATAVLLRALRQRSSLLWWTAYVAVTAVSVYTFYLSGLMLLAHGCYVLLTQRARWKEWLLASGGVAALASPWIGVLSDQVVRTGGGAADLAFGLVGIGMKVAYSAYAVVLGENLLPWRPPAIIGGLAASVLFVVGMLRWQRRGLAWPLMILLVVPMGGMMAAITALSPRTPFVSVPGRAFFAAPFFAIALAGAVEWLQRRWFWLLLGCLLVGWSAGLWNYYHIADHLNPIYATPSKEIVQFVTLRLEPGDMIYSDWDSGFEYYYQQTDASTPLVSDPDAARQLIAGGRVHRVWVVVLGRDQTERYFQASAAFREWLRTQATLMEVWGFAPLDPLYVQIKSALLGREAAPHRVRVELYEL